MVTQADGTETVEFEPASLDQAAATEPATELVTIPFDPGQGDLVHLSRSVELDDPRARVARGFSASAMFLGAGSIVALVLAFALPGPGSTSTGPPALSPDGRWWWDGYAWRPMPPGPPAAGTPYGYS